MAGKKVWRRWHFFDVNATFGAALTVLDLKYFEWRGDTPAQVHHTMGVWRTMRRRIRDPGDNSFMMAFRDALDSSKIPAFQLALLEFDRPDNANTDKRTLEFLEGEVDNWLLSHELKMNLKGHHLAAQTFCKHKAVGAPGVGKGKEGKGKGKGE